MSFHSEFVMRIFDINFSGCLFRSCKIAIFPLGLRSVSITRMFNIRRILLLFLFSITFCPGSKGQMPEESSGTSKPIRVEFPAKSTDETYRIIPCGETGMMLFFKSIELIGDSMSKWYFSFYDQNLNQSWVKSIPVWKNLMFQESAFNHDTLSMLFTKQGKEKSGRFGFTIFRLALKSSTFIGNNGMIPEEAEEIKFQMLHQLAFICYDLKNEPAQVQILQLQTGASNTFALSKGIASKASEFSVDTATLRIRAAISHPSSFKSRLENFLVSMDLNGKIIAEIPLDQSVSNRYLRGIEFVSSDPESWLVFGSYGSTPLKTTGKIKKATESSGFFTCKLNTGQLSEINFVNLLELNHSKDLLGEKDIIALKKKALKKNRSISDYSLDYPLLLHKVFRHNDQFILLAETFTPQYHSESFTDFDFYGRPYVNSYDVFDGYRYNNGIVAAFDKEGKLAWDNTLEIRNLLSYELVPKIMIFFTPENEAVLAYLSEGKIASKIIKENAVIEKLDFSPLELSNPEDKLLVESKSGILPWYDNFFLCYGYQEIKNIKSGGNNKRLVFQVTKIAFD